MQLWTSIPALNSSEARSNAASTFVYSAGCGASDGLCCVQDCAVDLQAIGGAEITCCTEIVLLQAMNTLPCQGRRGCFCRIFESRRVGPWSGSTGLAVLYFLITSLDVTAKIQPVGQSGNGSGRGLYQIYVGCCSAVAQERRRKGNRGASKGA